MKKILTLLTIAITGTVSAQTISGNMETWTNYSAGFPFPTTALEIPAGWHGSDSLSCTFGPLLYPSGSFVKQVSKSTDSHGGSFSAKLVTKNIGGSIGILPAVISNASKMELDTSQTIPIKFKGGVAVSQRLDYANAWVKFTPAVSGEETQMYVQAVIAGAGANGDDSVVGTGQGVITETTTWELVSTTIIYNSSTVVPTHIRVVFFSSFDNPNDGTALLVDDVTVSLFPASVENVYGAKAAKVYPTVTSGTLHIEPSITDALTITVHNMAGQLVAEKKFSGKSMVDLGYLDNGSYIYTIATENTLVQKGRFTIAK